MVHLIVWKDLSKQEGLELSFEVRQSGEIPRTAGERIPDRRAVTLKECSPIDFKLRLGSLEASRLRIGRGVMFDTESEADR